MYTQNLLLRFPTPASISELSEADFATQAWNLVGRKVHKAALLGEIYAVAARSVAIPGLGRHFLFTQSVGINLERSQNQPLCLAQPAAPIHQALDLGAAVQAFHSSFARYQTRTHLSLDKDCPDPRPVMLPGSGRVVAIPQVNGLHHRYERLAT